LAAGGADLAGRKVSLYDVDKFSWGGDVLLSSDTGTSAPMRPPASMFPPATTAAAA
jgi:hypothetical protein